MAVKSDTLHDRVIVKRIEEKEPSRANNHHDSETEKPQRVEVDRRRCRQAARGRECDPRR